MQVAARRQHLWRFDANDRPAWWRYDPRLREMIELFRQAASAAQQHGARDRLQQGTGLRCNQISSQDKHRALNRSTGNRRSQLVGAHQGFQRDLQVLHIRSRLFVDDDQVNRHLLHPPVFVGLQQLLDEVEFLDLRDADQHDWQVAGNTLTPEQVLSTRAALDGVGWWPERRIRVERMAGQALEPDFVVWRIP